MQDYRESGIFHTVFVLSGVIWIISIVKEFVFIFFSVTKVSHEYTVMMMMMKLNAMIKPAIQSISIVFSGLSSKNCCYVHCRTLANVKEGLLKLQEIPGK